MNPRVREVYPNQNYTLMLIFDNGEKGIFDVSPYLEKGIFSQLKDRKVFNSVRPFLGSVQWANGLDLCPDTLIWTVPEPLQTNTEGCNTKTVMNFSVPMPSKENSS